MKHQDLFKLLGRNAYPGRGILLGRAENGDAALAYFIMGRSENSRNRIFTETSDGIITEAANPAKLQDPSLILYVPVRKTGPYTIVTNGDQTDTIYDALQSGGSFEDALHSRTFEPDAPNYTPRISGLLVENEGGFSYRLSILKSGGGNPSVPVRYFFDYSHPLSGLGHLIHTYSGDGTPLPSFVGEPVSVQIQGGIDAFATGLWNALNAENKISLFVHFVSSAGHQTRLFNKYSKEVQP